MRESCIKYLLRVATFMMIGLSAPSCAQTGNLDCAEPKSSLDIAICANPQIVAIDAHMRQVHRQASAKLSSNGQKLFRDNDLQFRDDLQSICLSTDQLIVNYRTAGMEEYNLTEKAGISDACLATYLQARTKELEAAVQRAGQRTFLRLSSFRLWRPGPDAPAGYSERVIEESLALIQIDQPATHSEREFNIWTKELLRQTVCGTLVGVNDVAADRCSLDRQHDWFPKANKDIRAEVSVAMLTDDVAAVQNDLGYYWLGGAHPIADQSRALWSFKLGRQLKAADIFDSAKDWDASLSAYAQRHVSPTIDGMSKEGLRPIESIAGTENWSFERGGLRLIYGQYQLGGYLGSAEAFLPWHVIAPYLKPNSILDWRALANNGEIMRTPLF